MSIHVPTEYRRTMLPEGAALSGAWLHGWRHPLIAVSLVLFFLGLGVLAQAYMVEANTPAAYGWFWAGLGLSVGAAIITGLAPASTTGQRLLMLGLLGGALYLPTFLRSPAYPIFADELYHYQALTLMREHGTREVSLTFFTVPRDYPGLALLGLHIVSIAGLSSEWAVRLVPLLVHLTMPVLAYAALVTLRVPERLAFVGGLVYMSNRSFFFFHSVFSYETLGTLLFLVLALLSLNLLRKDMQGGVAGSPAPADSHCGGEHDSSLQHLDQPGLAVWMRAGHVGAAARTTASLWGAGPLHRCLRPGLACLSV